MSSPLERMIDEACRCQKCGLKLPTRFASLNDDRCKCIECCSCGYFVQPGTPCQNRATRRCTLKLKYKKKRR